MQIMKVKILKTTVADKKIVRAGQILDLVGSEAKFLINLKKAEPLQNNVQVEERVVEVLTETVLGEPAKKRGRKKT